MRQTKAFPKMFIAKALENTDQRIVEGKSIAPYFLFSTFLWDAVSTQAEANITAGLPESIAYQQAASKFALHSPIRIT
jgi:poly(A) polymerase